MQISLPAHGYRPIRLLDIQIEIFAGHQGIQQNRGLSATWPNVTACIRKVGANGIAKEKYPHIKNAQLKIIIFGRNHTKMPIYWSNWES